MAPSTCWPSDGDRSKWTKVSENPLRETPFRNPSIQRAIGALSQDSYDLLESFRKAFPTLHIENQSKTCNAFFLFRTDNLRKSRQGLIPQDEGQNAKNATPVTSENESTQQLVSRKAGQNWSGYSNREKAYYADWAAKIQRLHTTMYAKFGLPEKLKAKAGKMNAANKDVEKGKETSEKQKSQGDGRSAPSGARKSKSSKAKKVARNHNSRNAASRHYPSPSASDASVFYDTDDVNDDRPVSVELDENVSEGDDKEYLPNQRASRKRRAQASAPNKQKRARYQIPSPASTTRELSPPVGQPFPPPPRLLPSTETTLPSSQEVSLPPQCPSSPTLMYPPGLDSPSLFPLTPLLSAEEPSLPPPSALGRLFHPDDPDCPSLFPDSSSPPTGELSISHQCEPSPDFSFGADADSLSYPTLDSDFDDPILTAINMNFDYNVRLPMETLMLNDPHSNYHISLSSDLPSASTSAIAFSSDGYALPPLDVAHMGLDEVHFGLLPEIDPVFDSDPCYIVINADGNFTAAALPDVIPTRIDPSMLVLSSSL